MEYYKRGHKHAFIVLIKRGLHESKSRKAPSGPVVAKLNSLLAAHYIAEGVALPPAEKKRAGEYLEEATDCLNEAEKRNNNTIQPEEVTIRKGTTNDTVNVLTNVLNSCNTVYSYIY